MLEKVDAVNSVINNFIWGVPAMICIIGVGLYLSFRTRFLQIRKFPYAMKVTFGRMFKKKEAGDGCAHTVSGSLYGTCGNGWNRKCSRSSRSYRHRRSWCDFLDVDICTARYVYEVCRGYTCGAFSREK